MPAKPSTKGTSKRVGILLEQQYQELELWYPYYRLQEAGYRVELLAPEHKTYPGKYGYPAPADRTIKEAWAESYRGIIIPGGFAPDFLRRHPDSIAFVKEIWRQGGVVAAICHGAWILSSANILRGKRATCFSAISDDIKNAGAKYEDSEVVVDGKLVTSRKPEDLPAFCKAILEALHS